MPYMPEKVAVEATRRDFRALVHQPSGEGLDEAGKGLWPADQFTFRLIGEGAIRRTSDEGEPVAPASQKTAPSAATKPKRAKRKSAEPAPSQRPAETQPAPVETNLPAGEASPFVGPSASQE